MPNLFSKNSVCELGITFLAEGKEFSYDLHYDAQKEEFLYEKFSEIQKDQYGMKKKFLVRKRYSKSKIFLYRSGCFINDTTDVIE